jgi:hypothetical protein
MTSRVSPTEDVVDVVGFEIRGGQSVVYARPETLKNNRAILQGCAARIVAYMDGGAEQALCHALLRADNVQDYAVISGRAVTGSVVEFRDHSDGTPRIIRHKRVRDAEPNPSCIEAFRRLLPRAQKPGDTAMADDLSAWGAIDFSSLKAVLPAPGEYPATIRRIDLRGGIDTLWMAVRYSLDGLEAEPAPDLAAIAALDASPHKCRIPDGARLLYRLANATGLKLPAKLVPADIPKLFEGRRLRLALAHKVRDGVEDLVIRRHLPSSG